MMGDLPCRCFAYRAGYCNHLEATLSTVFYGKITESFYSIANLEYTIAGNFFTFDILADHGTGSTFGKGISYIIVTIEIVAGNSEEAITDLSSSRVGTYAGEIRFSILDARYSIRWMRFYYLGQGFD
jgi:hypothetical protein